MGQLALILALGALLIGGVIFLNVQRSSDEADETTTAYQVDRLAREAALVGLEQAERRLNDNPDAWALWETDPDAARALFEVPATTVDGATYAVTLDNIVMGTDPADPDEAWVTATGSYDGFDPGQDATGTTVFTVVAKYEKGYTDRGTPPSMREAIVAENSIDMSGSTLVSGDIHSNGTLNANGGAFDVYGDATFTGSETLSDSQQQQIHGDLAAADSIEIDHVDIPPSSFHHQVDGSGQGNVFTLDATNDPPGMLVDGWWGVTGHGTETSPYVFYVNGNLTILQDVRLPGFCRIYVNGNVDVGQGSGNATVLPLNTTLPTNWTQWSVEDMMDWKEANLPDGSQLGIYSTGDVSLSGTVFVAAQFYTEGTFEYKGGGNQLVMGGVTAWEDVILKGKAVLLYTDPNAAIFDPGMDRQVPDGLRLIAYREWAQRPSDPTP